MKKIVAILLGVALFGFASFGCTQKGSYKPPIILTDNLETFYIDETKDKVIVIGQNYHYVLQQEGNYDPQIKNLFFYLLEKSQTEPITFNISKDKSSEFISYNKITHGYYDIQAHFEVEIDNSASTELIQWATNLQNSKYKTEVFYKDPNHKYLSTRIFLGGNRYKAEPEINTKLTTLVHPISIEISDESLGEAVPPITPLKVDNNGSLTLNNQKLILLDNLEDRLR